MANEYELLHFFELDNLDNNLSKREIRDRRRRTRELNDPFNLSDDAFIKQYRLTPELAYNLCDELSPFLSQPTKSSDLSVETKVLTALSFYSHGSYQRPTGEQRGLSVAQQTVSTALAQVTDAMNQSQMRQKYLKFPQSPGERSFNKLRFYNKFGIPGVIGCIDGTHVAIVRPKEHEERFFCRKNYHSLNVQLESETGMYVSLSSFLGFGRNYVEQYFQKTGNAVFLHIHTEKKPVSEPEKTGDGPEKKITRLAIGVEGGFDPDSGMERFTYTDHYNVVLLPGFHTYAWPNTALPDVIKKSVQDIIEAESPFKIAKMAALHGTWDDGETREVSV